MVSYCMASPWMRKKNIEPKGVLCLTDIKKLKVRNGKGDAGLFEGFVLEKQPKALKIGWLPSLQFDSFCSFSWTNIGNWNNVLDFHTNRKSCCLALYNTFEMCCFYRKLLYFLATCNGCSVSNVQEQIYFLSL